MREYFGSDLPVGSPLHLVSAPDRGEELPAQQHGRQDGKLSELPVSTRGVCQTGGSGVTTLRPGSARSPLTHKMYNGLA